MLRSQQEMRLFGQRYGAIFAGLAIAASVLIVLLILNFPRTQGPTPEVDALKEVGSDWTLSLIIFALLGITAGQRQP